nr:hypothetical protein [Tanacetum cinerariifolium]
SGNLKPLHDTMGWSSGLNIWCKKASPPPYALSWPKISLVYSLCANLWSGELPSTSCKTETIGLPIEVEPLGETPLEDLGLNKFNHDIPPSSMEILSFDEPKPHLQPFPSFPSLKVYLGEERDPESPIRPLSPNSFRIKEVDHLTIHTPPSPHVASFHPKYVYCYYHPCIDDPKKHYGFKPGLLAQSESLCVAFLNLQMVENDSELES